MLKKLLKSNQQSFGNQNSPPSEKKSFIAVDFYF